MARHPVTQGDNLWSIAKHRLAGGRERSPKKLSNRKIAAYWLRVIAANAHSLVSGDPDLIYPGEVIVLPPVASAPTGPAPADQTPGRTPAPSPTPQTTTTTTTGPTTTTPPATTGPTTGRATTGPTTTGPTTTTTGRATTGPSSSTTTTGPTTTGPTPTSPSTTGRRPPAYDPSPADPPTEPPGEPGPDEPGTGGGRGGPSPRDEASHRVVAGDNLWTIARDHLIEAASGGSGKPTIREVAGYWVGVVEANRDRLRSGDPDLIYPGEEIVLPPLD